MQLVTTNPATTTVRCATGCGRMPAGDQLYSEWVCRGCALWALERLLVLTPALPPLPLRHEVVLVPPSYAGMDPRHQRDAFGVYRYQARA